jgi:hypothetical protein
MPVKHHSHRQHFFAFEDAVNASMTSKTFTIEISVRKFFYILHTKTFFSLRDWHLLMEHCNSLWRRRTMQQPTYITSKIHFGHPRDKALYK